MQVPWERQPMVFGNPFRCTFCEPSLQARADQGSLGLLKTVGRQPSTKKEYEGCAAIIRTSVNRPSACSGLNAHLDTSGRIKHSQKKVGPAMAKLVSPGLSQVTDVNRPLVRSCTCSGAVPGDVTFFLPTLGHCSLQTEILMNSQMKRKEACFQ